MIACQTSRPVVTGIAALVVRCGPAKGVRVSVSGNQESYRVRDIRPFTILSRNVAPALSHEATTKILIVTFPRLCGLRSRSGYSPSLATGRRGTFTACPRCYFLPWESFRGLCGVGDCSIFQRKYKSIKNFKRNYFVLKKESPHDAGAKNPPERVGREYVWNLRSPRYR